MKQKIAIEQNLTPVKEFLVNKGYSVESIDISKEYSSEMNKYDALIVTGLNKNFLGINNINTRGVVIEASGMTPEEIYNELQSTFH